MCLTSYFSGLVRGQWETLGVRGIELPQMAPGHTRMLPLLLCFLFHTKPQSLSTPHFRYDDCDIGTFPNQTLKDKSGPAAALHSDKSRSKYNFELSWLPGQRVSYVFPFPHCHSATFRFKMALIKWHFFLGDFLSLQSLHMSW